MRSRALVVALAALAAAAPAVARAEGAEVDAHALFAEGRFAAAAASFEKQFAATASPADGLNAVVAWRAAGRYAHARVVLATILAKQPTGVLATRAQLLATRLATLTGTLTVTGADRAIIIKIDGAPSERLGDDVIVDVGARDVSVEAEGCEPSRGHYVVRPTEHLNVAVKLACKAYPGSLHVALQGAPKARASIDGVAHDIPEFDLDVPLPSGVHHLVVERGRITIADEDVVVAAKETARRTIHVPWRGLDYALTGAATTIVHGTSDGQASAVGGVQLGIAGGADSVAAYFGWFELGYAANHDHTVPDAPYVGVGFLVRLFGPRIQHRYGATLVTLDVDPLAFHLGFTSSSPDGAPSTNLFYWNLGAATLTLEVPHVHLEAQLWPAGWATNGVGQANVGGTHFASELTLTAGWAWGL